MIGPAVFNYQVSPATWCNWRCLDCDVLGRNEKNAENPVILCWNCGREVTAYASMVRPAFPGAMGPPATPTAPPNGERQT